MEQAKHSGEVNVPWREGAIDAGDIHGELGAVVTGRIPGRVGDERTVFDSTGLAIQDVATAHVAYTNLAAPDDGTTVRLVDAGGD